MAAPEGTEMDRDSILVRYVIGKIGGAALDEAQFQAAAYRILRILDIDPATVGFHPHIYGPRSDLVDAKRRELEDGCAGAFPTWSDVAPLVSPLMNMDGLIGHLVDTAGSFTDEELLLLAYCDYEKGAEGSYILASDVKDDVIARRIDMAIGMYHDGRVSLGRGAELAGMPLGSSRTSSLTGSDTSMSATNEVADGDHVKVGQ